MSIEVRLIFMNGVVVTPQSAFTNIQLALITIQSNKSQFFCNILKHIHMFSTLKNFMQGFSIFYCRFQEDNKTGNGCIFIISNKFTIIENFLQTALNSEILNYISNLSVMNFISVRVLANFC